ncbi:MAG: DinB family protein [Burkholderiales bacterium]|nr:DinB family protein [Burkholderiales bacterium]MDP2398526.1 DinB family protein [Burkholderiales bacterium]
MGKPADVRRCCGAAAGGGREAAAFPVPQYEGREHGYSARNTNSCPPLEELRAQQQAIDAWYVGWADGLDDADFARTVGFTLIGGNRGSMTCGEILIHVVTHASYHRGYVADMIYDTPGHRPPTMDLPVYMREGRAAV